MTLDGRVAIVTGGATGIGHGVATVLAERGARVAIVQPSIEQAEQGAATVAGAVGFAADVRDRAAVNAMVDRVAERLGRVDILVNNAALTGLPAVSPFATMPEAHVDDVIDVNLKGAIWCSQAAARRMIESGAGGAIVHIASVGAYAAQELGSIYCATKAALVSLAQSMALELAPYGIRVNAVAPGDIETPASATIVTDLRTLGATGQYIRRTPLGRRGTPLDIGEAVSFLCGPQAAFITGTCLTVDGGFLTY
ncbi:MAG: SDR family oxidoreductase [Acidobacteria bacterium]|nr:SDR family oxidoreductase [Acidobacteriota bacterium]